MKYRRDFTADEVKVLEHFVEDAKEWIDTAIAEKIASCRKRLIRQQMQIALDTNGPLPSTGEAALASVFDKPDYKNRKQRIVADEPKATEKEKSKEPKDDGKPVTPAI